MDDTLRHVWGSVCAPCESSSKKRTMEEWLLQRNVPVPHFKFLDATPSHTMSRKGSRTLLCILHDFCLLNPSLHHVKKKSKHMFSAQCSLSPHFQANNANWCVVTEATTHIPLSINMEGSFIALYRIAWSILRISQQSTPIGARTCSQVSKPTLDSSRNGPTAWPPFLYDAERLAV